MKKAVLKELQSQLLGFVSDNPEALQALSTDQGLFQVEPTAVVYPANTADVRKTVQLAHTKTAAGKPLQLTARGLGSGTSGGALGDDTQVVFSTHLNKLLRLDHDRVSVQPGLNFRALQQTLHTHARWLPVYPSNLDTATVGGAVAESLAGTHSVKYGPLRQQVRGLKVVLSDGSLIEAHRISARELNRKKGHTTLEGEIYRKLDSLILDHADLIRRSQPKVPYTAGGYALDAVRGKDGSFDLSQIFMGAEGTLGFITEVTLATAAYNPRTSLLAGYFDSTYAALEAAGKLRGLGPSALELADHGLLEAVMASHPGYLDGLLPDDTPATVLLVQFDQLSQFSQRLALGRAERIIKRLKGRTRTSTDPVEQLALWKLRAAASLYAEPVAGSKRSLPFLDGAVVPVASLSGLVEKVAKLLKKYELTAAIWGHVGDGQLTTMPRLDPTKKKDADKLFNLARDYASAVASLGGDVSGSAGDGLLRSLTYTIVHGEELAELFAAVKHIFDPHGVFAPNQKTQATADFARAHLRHDYLVMNPHVHDTVH